MVTNAPLAGRSRTYLNGQPYRLARGRYSPQERVVDRLERTHAVINLDRERLHASSFLRRIVREMRIRFYLQKTIKLYRNALAGFLRWLGHRPDEATREDVREYLLYLVDAGAGASWVSINLSAIRTAFDKMCLRDLTLGLMTPRRPKRLPVVLSRQEVRRLLEAAPRLRDKLLLGLMYATGVRVSEVVRLRARDLDFDRRVINVWQGKGRTDREVILPQTFESLLKAIAAELDGDAYLFPGERRGRHLSPRTAQRVMERAVRIAGIKKRATPHTLRHSFSCHSFENGCDIRNIQKLLGHVHLETTTIYLRLAERQPSVASPLDELAQQRPPGPKPVGRLKLHLKPMATPDGEPCAAKVTIGIDEHPRTVYLTGIIARQVRPGWITLEVPPLEHWEQQLSWLPPEKRERIEGAAFFELLQREIPRRFQQAVTQGG